MTANDGMVDYYKHENENLRRKLSNVLSDLEEKMARSHDELAVKYQECKEHLINMVNTVTVDYNDAHSTDQVKALQGAEEWLRKNV